MQDICLNGFFVLGYLIGAILAAIYAGRWDETVDAAEDVSSNSTDIRLADNDNVDDLKTIRDALGGTAVS